MVERGCPYQLNLVVDSSTAARCSALDTALDFNLGTRLYRRRRPVATGSRDAPLSAHGEA